MLAFFVSCPSRLENLRKTDVKLNKLAIHHIKGFDVIKISDIILCEADAYCTIFHLANKSKIISSHNLKYYEELLPGEKFIRVHHSFIINMEHVKSYTFQGEIILTDDLRSPLSSTRKGEFIKLFKTPKKI